jgi:hypothetical protein
MNSTGARSCDQMLRCDLRVGVAGGAARCCRTKLYCIWAFRDSGNPLPHPVRPSVSPTFLLSLLRIVLVLFHNFSRQCSHESSPLNKTPFRFLAVLRKPDVIFTFLEDQMVLCRCSHVENSMWPLLRRRRDNISCDTIRPCLTRDRKGDICTVREAHPK